MNTESTHCLAKLAGTRAHRTLLTTLIAVTSVCFTSAESSGAWQSKSQLLKNGNLKDWVNQAPVDWIIEVGATNGGNAPLSVLKKLPGGGVTLSGDARTKAWRTLKQDVRIRPGSSYALNYRAKAEAVVREQRQYDNCFVAVMMFDRNGKRIDMAIRDLSKARGTRISELQFSPPPTTAKASVVIFLSKSGKLSVSDLSLSVAKTKPPFEQLMTQLEESYSFTELKKIDWKKLRSKYQRAAEASRSADDFARAVKPMLAELNDIHVSIELANGKRIYPSSSGHTPNYNFDYVRSQVVGLKAFTGCGFVGKTKDQFGVVVITALPRSNNFESMLKAIRELDGVRGWIIDIRRNSGGSETQAASIAGMFTKKPMKYGRQKIRTNGKLSESKARSLSPVVPHKSGKIVCLIGPGCVSSGEGMALMMKSIPSVMVIGQPTRGASGNPQAITLSNGLRVWFSRWISMEMDGTPIEGRGVFPDQRVRHESKGDPTFDKACDLLKASR